MGRSAESRRGSPTVGPRSPSARARRSVPPYAPGARHERGKEGTREHARPARRTGLAGSWLAGLVWAGWPALRGTGAGRSEGPGLREAGPRREARGGPTFGRGWPLQASKVGPGRRGSRSNDRPSGVRGSLDFANFSIPPCSRPSDIQILGAWSSHLPLPSRVATRLWPFSAPGLEAGGRGAGG